MRSQTKYRDEVGLIGSGEAFIAVRERADLGRGKYPVAQFHHSAANDWDAVAPKKFWRSSIANIFGLMDAFAALTVDLCDLGYCVISTEHREPTSSDATQRTWGSDRDRARNHAARVWAQTAREPSGAPGVAGLGGRPGKFLPWGMSMGGISVMNQIKAHGADIAGALVIHGVADLQNGNTGLGTGVFPLNFLSDAGYVSTVSQAFRSNGTTPVDGYTTGSGGCSHTGLSAGTVPSTAGHWVPILAEHNPVEFAAALPVKPPILWFVAPDDPTCSPASQYALAAAYGPNMTVITENETGAGAHFSSTWYRNYRGVILDFLADRRAEIVAA